MHIITQKRLKEFWQKHPDSESSLRNWYNLTRIFNMIKVNENKINGSVTDDQYLNLLLQFPPRPIKSEEDFDQVQEVIDNLIDRDNLTSEEKDYLNVLGSLVRNYEDLHHRSMKLTQTYSLTSKSLFFIGWMFISCFSESLIDLLLSWFDSPQALLPDKLSVVGYLFHLIAIKMSKFNKV